MSVESTIDFLAPISVQVVLIGAAVGLAGYLLIRWALGPPSMLARRRGLLVLRMFVLGVLLALLLNPVWVDETPGSSERPEVFYLLDSSESMAMGSDSTRWDDALRTIGEANASLRSSAEAKVSLFRFGHKLSAIESPEQLGLRPFDPPVRQGSRSAGFSSSQTAMADTAPQSDSSPKLLKPDDTDTQLLPALRQISSRFGRTPPAALVLFSDGRARDAQGAEELARYFARMEVPIHVVPVGNMARGGDVAIVGMVAPRRVRKFSKVDVQVFLRSFGYDGRRTILELWSSDEDGQHRRKLASQPVTLRSGVQGVTLTFQSDLQSRNLRASIQPQSDEVSDRNNAFTTEIEIDRTKIRVLYVEGSPKQPTAVSRDGSFVLRGPYSDLQDALIQDPDIECVTIAAPHGPNSLRRIGPNGPQSDNRAFPQTTAQLSAFDALILSDVSRDTLTEEHLEWIEHWVSHRGAGLCMVGGRSSFAAGGWDGTLLVDMLPVHLQSGGSDWRRGKLEVQPRLSSMAHPIWHIVNDEARNRSIVQSFPAFTGMNRLQAKSDLATVLATVEQPGRDPLPRGNNSAGVANNSEADWPAIVAGQYGKGRTLAVSAAITAPWAQEFVTTWGEDDNRYYAKFWRNVVYWLTERSAIGRRRLVVSADKQYYQPGESISLQATAFDEGATHTADYRVVAMIEPRSELWDLESLSSPLLWPEGIPRTSGEEGPYIIWGEEIELTSGKPLSEADNNSGYGLQLTLADPLPSASSSQSLRIELTAYEGFTQVDSTSMDLQILHDPFEQQNPFPDHELLKRIASTSSGRVLADSKELAAMLRELPIQVGPPTIRKVPVWSRWWLLSLLLALLTVEWLWRRKIGLA